MYKLSLLTLAIMSTLSFASDVDEEQILKSEAKSIIKQFAGQLKPELIATMTNGGPVQAIEVCAKRAPQIAAELSEKSGWDVSRVSLKARNSSTARPDDWEKDILEKFDQRAERGEDPEQITHYALTKDEFRFMKAQPVESVCLNCHGANMMPSVKQALKAHYPEDTATGYIPGQIRGAFSLIKKLEK